MKKLLFIYIGLIVAALTACNEGKTTPQLEVINKITDENPDSALALISMLEQEKTKWSEFDRMRYELIKMKAENKTHIVFSSDSTIKALVDFFDRKGSANEKMLAHYLLGRVLSDLGEAPEALQAYYDAISMADTTNVRCDNDILIATYGQMSHLFHQQNLPIDEIWALRHYIRRIEKNSGAVDVIIAKSQLIRPFYLLGEKDSVLHIIYDCYNQLEKLGHHKEAAEMLGTAIYIHTERGEIDKARREIEIFEHDSGIFDNKGNISRGRESYYYIKGLFELAVNQPDSAEHYFRRAINYGYLSAGYKGLLSVYRGRNNIDSIIVFSKMYEIAQDSLHNNLQTDVIHKMSSLYNYSRKQKEAELAKEKFHNAVLLLSLIVIIAITLLVAIIIIIFQYKKKQKEREEKIELLEGTLSQAKEQRSIIQQELKQLKEKDYEGIINDKMSQEAELSKTIEHLQAENNQYKLSTAEIDDVEGFANTTIAVLFIKKATDKSESIIPSEAEWRMLQSQFCKYIPVTFKSFSTGKGLSQLEQRICILLILGISEKIISLMTKSAASTVSNAKARANEKLFGKKEAQSLKNNLISTTKQA